MVSTAKERHREPWGGWDGLEVSEDAVQSPVGARSEGSSYAGRRVCFSWYRGGPCGSLAEKWRGWVLFEKWPWLEGWKIRWMGPGALLPGMWRQSYLRVPSLLSWAVTWMVFFGQSSQTRICENRLLGPHSQSFWLQFRVGPWAFPFLVRSRWCWRSWPWGCVLRTTTVRWRGGSSAFGRKGWAYIWLCR